MLIRILFFLMLVHIPFSGFGQKMGKIMGTVVDAETGERLVGVNVFVDGTQKGQATDPDGRFEIGPLEAGDYTLVASFISYARKRIYGVNVREGDTTTIDIALEPASKVLGEVTVSAEAILNSQAALLRERQKSISVSDAISAESMARAGTGDAAQAIKKVTGASVVAGKYVFIRGLGDRYSSTQLNGSELPSADPDRKTFQLDIIPTSLLENIVALKTFTPDKPGNFSGGLVNVATKEFPDRLTFQASISGAYNSRTTGSKAFLPESGPTDWLGLGSDYRSLPKLLHQAGINIPFESEARFDGQKAQMLDQVSRAFRPEMAPSYSTIPIDRSMLLSFGNQTQLWGRTLGFSGSLSYNRSFTAVSNGNVGRYQLVGELGEGTPLAKVFQLSDEWGTAQADLGGLLSVAYKISGHHIVSGTYLRSQSGTSTGRYLSGYWDEFSDGTYETRVSHYTERSLTSWQFKGRHWLDNWNNVTLDWNLSTSNNQQDEPDLRYFTNGYLEDINGQRQYSIAASLYPRPTRFFRYLTESATSAGIDLGMPISKEHPSIKIKLGGLYQTTERDFNERRFEYRTGSRSSVSLNTYDGDVNRFVSDVGLSGQQNGQFIFSNYITEASSLKNNYQAEMQIKAFYSMLEAQLGENLRFVGGARFEHAFQKTASADSSLMAGINDNRDWLPSLNFIYSINERGNLRASYTHTVARPNFRELAPYATFDFVGDYVLSGNDSLRRTLIQNIDLRWEWFPSTGEVISVSTFYKRLQNPIERALRIDVNRSSTVQNVQLGQVYGLEFEVRKRLGFISASLDDLAVTSNLTLVRSVVDIPVGELYLARLSDSGAKSTRTLQGQSPFIVNTDLSYDNSRLGLSADLSFHLFGDRMHSVVLGAAPDVFERSSPLIDLMIRKSFISGVELNLSAKNLLDPEMKLSQQLHGREYVYQSHRLGRTVSVGLKYAL